MQILAPSPGSPFETLNTLDLESIGSHLSDAPPILRWHGNLLEDDLSDLLQSLSDGHAVILDSGWIGSSSDGIYQSEFQTWTKPAWERFESAIAILHDAATKASPGALLILRGHARHVLADPQSTLAWLLRCELERVRILLDPAAWLTEPMLAESDDHMSRACEAFRGHPRLWGLAASGVEPVELPAGDLDAPPNGRVELRACPLGSESDQLGLDRFARAAGHLQGSFSHLVLPGNDPEAAARIREAILVQNG